MDTVVRHRTWGSRGSAMTAGTNQLAALPSLHFALALWVVFLLAVAGAPWSVRLVGVANVVVTLVVIVATGNHYLVDAVAAVVLVAVSLFITAPRRRRTAGSATGSTTSAPNVAGVLVLDSSDVDAAVSAVRTEINGAGPRWRQCLKRRSWRKPPRWPSNGEPDWSWHIVRREPWSATGPRGGPAVCDGSLLRPRASRCRTIDHVGGPMWCPPRSGTARRSFWWWTVRSIGAAGWTRPSRHRRSWRTTAGSSMPCWIG